MQFAVHNNLDNVVLIVDNNKRQLDGYTHQICDAKNLGEKFSAFGMAVFEANGHDVLDIQTALNNAKNAKRPSVVILDTIKGHGCCFAEIDGFNHYMIVSSEMADKARAEIDRRLQENE